MTKELTDYISDNPLYTFYTSVQKEVDILQALKERSEKTIKVAAKRFVEKLLEIDSKIRFDADLSTWFIREYLVTYKGFSFTYKIESNEVKFCDAIDASGVVFEFLNNTAIMAELKYFHERHCKLIVIYNKITSQIVTKQNHCESSLEDSIHEHLVSCIEKNDGSFNIPLSCADIYTTGDHRKKLDVLTVSWSSENKQYSFDKEVSLLFSNDFKTTHYFRYLIKVLLTDIDAIKAIDREYKMIAYTQTLSNTPA